MDRYVGLRVNHVNDSDILKGRLALQPNTVLRMPLICGMTRLRSYGNCILLCIVDRKTKILWAVTKIVVLGKQYDNNE